MYTLLFPKVTCEHQHATSINFCVSHKIYVITEETNKYVFLFEVEMGKSILLLDNGWLAYLTS
jgi:hypothetical protein